MYPSMNFRDSRGVSELLGAILLFGLLISLLIIVQATAVPNANEQVEFQHSQGIQGDMLRLADDIDSVAVTGSDQLSVLDLGVSYPNRFLLFNPPPAAGTLSTTGDASFTIANARAIGEVGDYWNGSAVSFDSQSVAYRPAYNVYQGAPTTRYESGVVVNAFDNGKTNVGGGKPFIKGNRINLIAVQGDRDVSRTTSLALDVVPLSGPARTVTVTDTGSPIVITIATDLPASLWSEILAGEPNVQSVDPGPTAGTVAVTLAGGKSYELRLASVGVSSGVTDPPSHYITTVSEKEVTLDSSDESTPLTVEVRDRYNNPVANAVVTFSSSGGTFDDTIATTDADGQATATFMPDDPGTKFVTATINSNSAARARATFIVNAGAVGVDSIATEYINSGYNSNVLLAETERLSGGGAGSRIDVNLTFENVGQEDRTATAARIIGVFSSDGRVDSIEYAGTTLSIGGQYKTLVNPYPIASAQSSDPQTLSLLGSGLGGVNAEVTMAIRYANGEISRYTFEAATDSDRLTDADRVTVAEATTTGTGDSGVEVQFTVTDGSKTVTAMRVDGSSSGADRLQWDAGREIAGPSLLDGYDGTVDFGTTYDTGLLDITLTNGDTITMQQFHDGGNRIDMSGEVVTFTLVFGDGSERTYTVPVTD